MRKTTDKGIMHMKKKRVYHFEPETLHPYEPLQIKLCKSDHNTVKCTAKFVYNSKIY